MGYRSEVDGLRAIAVSAVILFHAGFELFSGGFVGVDVFFVISGYLITSLIIRDLKAGSFDLKSFYLRRARRILPALFLVTLACFPLAWLLFDLDEIASFSNTVFGIATFSSNIVLWMQDSYFGPAADTNPLLHTWSLAVEEQYYLFFPFVCLVLWRLGRKILITSVFFAFFLSFCLGEWGSYSHPAAAFYLLPTRAWEILLGALVALYLDGIESLPVSRRAADIISAIGLVMLVAAIFVFDESTPLPGIFLAVPVLGTALIIVFSYPHGVVGRALSWRPCVALGLISYSLYLWHQPVFAFFRYVGWVQNGGLGVVLLIASIIPLSYVTWRFVEKPFRQNVSFVSKVSSCSVLGSLAVLALIGWFGFELYVTSKYGAAVIPVARQYSDPGGYVNSRWSDFELKEFDEIDDRKRVMLIGDSYAKDLLNAVQEGAIHEDYVLSTYHISARCGNLWTQKDLSGQVDQSDAKYCSNHPRYDSTRLKFLIGEADEVWLASNWAEWHLPFIKETIANIHSLSDVVVRIFATKGFGDISFKDYMVSQNKDGKILILPVDPNVSLVNIKLKELVGNDNFIDVQQIMCGSQVICQNITDDALLISYDGSHLTPAGAQLLGQKLSQLLGAKIDN